MIRYEFEGNTESDVDLLVCIYSCNICHCFQHTVEETPCSVIHLHTMDIVENAQVTEKGQIDLSKYLLKKKKCTDCAESSHENEANNDHGESLSKLKQMMLILS